MYKIGLSSCGFELNRESFTKLKSSKIDSIEISPKRDKYVKLNFPEIRKLADEHGVEIWSMHLPFSEPHDLDIASTNSAIRAATLTELKEYIKKGADIGIDKFVVHPSSEPKSVDEKRCDEIEASKESLNTLAEFAAENGAVMAVENLPRTCLGNNADELYELISVNDKLRVCFDTNHLLSETHADFLSRLADKIVTVHISDYDRLNERHWLPGEGDIDWNELYNLIKQHGYNGVWLYELGQGFRESIHRDRELTFDDFYTNAKEIFSGSKITVIGKRIEGIGLWPI